MKVDIEEERGGGPSRPSHAQYIYPGRTTQTEPVHTVGPEQPPVVGEGTSMSPHGVLQILRCRCDHYNLADVVIFSVSRGISGPGHGGSVLYGSYVGGGCSDILPPVDMVFPFGGRVFRPGPYCDGEGLGLVRAGV